MEFQYAHTELAQKALLEEADHLEKERGVSPNDAMVIAAATMDGAGDHKGRTVEGIATCMDLFGETVEGVSGDDIPEKRRDPYAESEQKRHSEARRNVDLGGTWLTLSKIPDGGMEVAKKMGELVNEDEGLWEKRFKPFLKECTRRKFSDPEIVQALKEAMGV